MATCALSCMNHEGFYWFALILLKSCEKVQAVNPGVFSDQFMKARNFNKGFCICQFVHRSPRIDTIVMKLNLRPKKKYVCFLSHAQIQTLGSVGRLIFVGFLLLLLKGILHTKMVKNGKTVFFECFL